MECCNLLADNGLEKLTTVTTLTQLTLGGSITDWGLDCVCHLPRLAHLGVAWCTKLTGKGLCNFIQNSPQLSRLSVFHCDNVDFSDSLGARCAQHSEESTLGRKHYLS